MALRISLVAVAGVAAALTLATGCGSTLSASTGGDSGLNATGGSAQTANGTSPGTGIGSNSTSSTTGGNELAPAATTGSANTAGGGGTGSNATGSTESSGFGTAAAGATTTSSGSGASIGGISPSGFGYTAKTISIGITTENDVDAAFAAIGDNTFDAGNQVADLDAVIKEVNAQGGLFGRQVVAVDDNTPATSVETNPTSTSESVCTYFTQDHPVVAVLNLETALDTSTLRSCFAGHHVPVMSLSVAPVDNVTLQQTNGYLIPLLAPTWNELAPVLVAQLNAEHFFTGWNTATGTATSGKAKVGVIVPDDAPDQRIAGIISNALAPLGLKPLVFEFTNTDQLSNAVLQFRSAGVTQVIEADSSLAEFMIQAQDQDYRPRYAITSFNAPQAFLEGIAPAKQLLGALGFGTAPTLDVDSGQDPPGQPYCLSALTAGGQTFTGHRFAEAVALAECDGVRMLVAAAKAADGLTGPDLVAGVLRTGPTFSPAFAFNSGFSANNYTLPGSGKDLAYNTGCSCFAYTGGVVTL